MRTIRQQYLIAQHSIKALYQYADNMLSGQYADQYANNICCQYSNMRTICQKYANNMPTYR